jgi:hypothetical protein
MLLHTFFGIDNQKVNIFEAIKKIRLKILISCLILIYLIPIWVITYFPSQDGPSHLYNAQILKEYNNSDYKFNEFYDLNLKIFPNWFSHAFLAGLMYVFPPLIAEKLLISIYIILFPLSLFYLINAVNKGNTSFGILGFLFIYNYLFHMGFYNFVLSIPLFFFVLGYWWKNKDSLRYRNIIILNLLICVVFFCHLVSYVLALISIFVLSALYYRKKVKKTLLSFCYLLPSYVPFAIYIIGSDFLRSGKSAFGFWQMPQLIIDFISMKSLVSYSKYQFIITYILFAFIMYLFFWTLVNEKMKLKGNIIQIKLDHRDYFLLISALVLVLYFFMPSSMGGGGFVTDRLSLYPFLIILPWFSVKQSKIHKYILHAFIVIICIVNVVYVSYYYITLDRDMKEFVSKVDLIEKNKTILPMPLDPYGKSYRIGIFFNSFGYYCLQNGGINLGNYEAGTAYFPTKYKEGFERPPLVTVLHAPKTLDITKCASMPIDYVIIWGTDPGIENEVAKHWTLMSSTGRLRVFRR